MQFFNDISLVLCSYLRYAGVRVDMFAKYLPLLGTTVKRKLEVKLSVLHMRKRLRLGL